MVVQIKILLAVVFIVIVIDVSACFVVILTRFKRFQAAALLHMQSALT